MNHLLRIYQSAIQPDIQTGLDSFANYHRLTYEIAAKHGFPGNIGAAVFSALSPNSDYLGNIRDVERLLRAARAGLGLDDFTVSTYGNNKRKAWRIAQGEDPLDLIVALKTRNFYLNIDNPNAWEPVTIDGHMFCAWLGEKQTLKGLRIKDQTKTYHLVAEEIRKIARQVGRIPNQVQAIIWHTWKRMHNTRYEFQEELWVPDRIKAQLPWQPHVAFFLNT